MGQRAKKGSLHVEIIKLLVTGEGGGRRAGDDCGK